MSRPQFAGMSENSKETAAREGNAVTAFGYSFVDTGDTAVLLELNEPGRQAVELVTCAGRNADSGDAFVVSIWIGEDDGTDRTGESYIGWESNPYWQNNARMFASFHAGSPLDLVQPLTVEPDEKATVVVQHNGESNADVQAEIAYRVL